MQLQMYAEHRRGQIAGDGKSMMSISNIDLLCNTNTHHVSLYMRLCSYCSSTGESEELHLKYPRKSNLPKQLGQIK